jgi:hypothetical protein
MSSSRNLPALFFFFLVAMLVSMSCQFVTQSTSDGSKDKHTSNATPGQPTGTTAGSNATKQKLSLQGQIGGSAYAVDVQGNFAYLGVGPRIYVLDTSNPSAPKFIGQSGVMPGVVRSVIASGNYVYVANEKGYLRVIDVSDATQPREVASLVEHSYAQGLALNGTTLYIADNPFGMRVVDVSDPLNPRKIGEVEIPGAASSIDIEGSRAFLAGSTDENNLAVIDISNPAQPVKTASIVIPETEGSVVYAVKVRDNYAYIAAGNPGLIVVDISDPTQPIKAGAFDTPWADGLVIEGNTLYLADMDGLYMLDISDPKNPSQTGMLALPLFQQEAPGQRNMVIQNGKVFFANGNQGMLVVDASVQPTLTGRFDVPLPGADFDVLVDSNIAYVIADTLGLYTINVTDPTQPEQLGFDISRISNGLRTPYGIAVNGQYAYIADINNGFSVYDISDPSDLRELSRIEKPQGMTDVAVSGNFAYVSMHEHETSEKRGMLVYDVSNPSQPNQVGFVNIDHSSWAVAVHGANAYIPELVEMVDTSQSSNLLIFDISNPTNPVEAGKADTTINAPSAMCIEVEGNYAYIGDLTQGLRIFDISNPGMPVEIGSLPDIRMVYDLAVVGDKVFTASYAYVSVVDVSDPVKPVLEEVYTSSGLSMGIDAVGNTIYVADMHGGMAVLKYEK